MLFRFRQPVKYWWRGIAIFILAAISLSFAHTSLSQSSAGPPQTASAQPDQTKPQTNAPALPRGKKLILKDGGFQLVREYKVEGDRVRYYSLDSSQWEEMPAALVDWDATKKIEAEEAKQATAFIEKVDTQEKAIHAEQQLDIDASVEAAPGVFLPPGEGLFAFDGKAVLPLGQSQTNTNLNKKQLLKQILVPVPVIPSRSTISIPGAHSRLRLLSAQLEFYMRTADGREPEMELIRTHIHGDVRQMENLDVLFGEQHTTRDTISMQKWQIARGVYRFTLAKPLDAGEYALAEIVQKEAPSLYVWDFGVDGRAKTEATVPKPR